MALRGRSEDIGCKGYIPCLKTCTTRLVVRFVPRYLPRSARDANCASLHSVVVYVYYVYVYACVYVCVCATCAWVVYDRENGESVCTECESLAHMSYS